jgi:hypothetical protein
MDRKRSRSTSEPLDEAVHSVWLLDVKTDVERLLWERERDARYEKVVAARVCQRVPGSEEHIGVSHRILQRRADFPICSAAGVFGVAERKPCRMRSENCTCARIFGPPLCGRLATSRESRSTIPLRAWSAKGRIVGEHGDDDDVRAAPRPARDRRTNGEHCVVEMW